MEFLKIFYLDFFTLGLYAVLILTAICIVAHNAKKVGTVVLETNSISCRDFFTTLLALLFRQFSSIIIFGLINTVARLYLNRGMLGGIGFFFTESASLFKTNGVGLPLIFLISIVVIPFIVKFVKHLKRCRYL